MEDLEAQRLEAMRLQAKLLQRGLSEKLGGQPTNTQKLIAELDGGGKVYRGSDGTLEFSSPGYSTTDQDKIMALMEGATPKGLVQQGRDEEYLSQPISTWWGDIPHTEGIPGRLQEYGQGAIMVGEHIDQIMDNTNALTDSQTAGGRALSGAMERQHPWQSAGLNIAGGIATAAPLAALGGGLKVADYIGRGGGLLAKGVRAASVAAPLSAIETASSFAGRADDGNRVKEAAKGAAIGAATGVLTSVVAPFVGAGAGKVAQRIKSLDVTTIADSFGISRKSAAIVKGYLRNDDFASAQRILSRSDDALLAEAGPSTRNALDTAMQTGGKPLVIGSKAVNARVNVAATKFGRAVDDILGTADGGIKKAAKEISENTKAARQAAYNRAYAQPTPTVGRAADEIADALDRIDPKMMTQAIAKANARMRADKLVNQNIVPIIDDATGNISYSQPLNILQMDQIKRALSDLVSDGTDKLTGKMSSDAALSAKLSGRLAKALRDNIPGYKEAMKLGGDTIQDTNALVMGRKLLSTTTTVEDVRDAMKAATVTSRAAARKGLRENIEAVMGNAKTTMADLESGNFDFETGINEVAEAIASVRNLTTGNNALKAKIVLGQDGGRLMSELQKMADAMVLRSAVARNSATAIRMSGQAAIAAQTQPNLAKRAVGGLSPTEVTRALTGTDDASISRQTAEYMAEIADALTRIKGDEAKAAIAVVQRAMAGQPVRDAEAEMVGRLFATGAFVAGERAGAMEYNRITQPTGTQ